MTRPWKHPDSGVYWFRRSVPQRLRKVVGKREEKISLRTKDPTTAKLRHAKMAADVETRWTNLAMPRGTLSEAEAHKLAAVMHQRYFAKFADNPSSGFWNTEIGANLWQEDGPLPDHDSPLTDGDWLKLGRIRAYKREGKEWCLLQAECELNSLGMHVDEAGKAKLAHAIAARAANRCLKTQQNYRRAL